MYQTNCIIALGSNTGNCIYHLKKAIIELEKLGSIKKIASLYLSKPYGYINQNDFYNTAVVLKTAQQPMQLMKNIKKIEKKLQKNKKILNGPRKIDIDIIFYNQLILNTHNLTIPHPRACERDFVLLPVCNLVPFFRHPVYKLSIKDLVKKLKNNYLIKKLSNTHFR